MSIFANKVLKPAPIALLFGAFALSACGNTTAERGLSGAGIGAGVGAAGSAIVGGSVAGGAILGGAVGAATGVLTDRNNLDLGDFPRSRRRY
ncbi:MAG: hypothetical protein AAF909_13745 [Pseudomonadota bacterium]